MEEQKSVKELKECLDLVLAGLEIGVKASADGKVDAQDLGHLLMLVPTIGPAMEGIGEIPAELADLSEAEAAELIAHVMAKLAVEDEKARLVIGKGLKVLVAGYDLVKAIKE